MTTIADNAGTANADLPVTTPTLVPFAHATEHPDYIEAQQRRDDAQLARDSARSDRAVIASVIASGVAEGRHFETDEWAIREYRERTELEHVAAEDLEQAREAFDDVRERLGLRRIHEHYRADS